MNFLAVALETCDAAGCLIFGGAIGFGLMALVTWQNKQDERRKKTMTGTYVQTGNRLDLVVEGNKIVGLKPWDGDIIPLPYPDGLSAVLKRELGKI